MRIPKDMSLASMLAQTPLTYAQKLKDPRWQRKRLKVLERDEFTCQICRDTKHTLNVHHTIYVPDVEPWEYPDSHLVTLCEKCHHKETAEWVATTYLLSAAGKGVFRFAEIARNFAIATMWWCPEFDLSHTTDTGIFIAVTRYLASHPEERRRLAEHIITTDTREEYPEIAGLLAQGKTDA